MEAMLRLNSEARAYHAGGKKPESKARPTYMQLSHISVGELKSEYTSADQVTHAAHALRLAMQSLEYLGKSVLSTSARQKGTHITPLGTGGSGTAVPSDKIASHNT
jgi:hypothetical protein